MFSKLYDKLLYAYCYLEVSFWAKVDDFNDFRRNVNWIRKNGVHRDE
jgi:hypothetical protein